MDRLGTMEAFVRVADSKSFSEAARRLRSSKSLVSRQVAALEAELGVRLFHRTTRSLTLTEEGRGYYAQVTRILAEIDDANRSVSQAQASPRGKLKLSAPMSFGILHLAPALPDFFARCPEVEIDLSLNDRFVDVVDEGFDLAIRIGRLADSSLVARRLASLRLVLCASAAYLAKNGLPESPEDLRRHQCLCYSTNSLAPEWRLAGRDGKDIAVPVTGRLHANNGDVLRIAALRGQGIVYLPSFIVGADLQAGTLVSLLPEFMPSDGGIYAVYPHSRHLSAKVRAFIDFLAERFGPRPYWDLVE